MKANNLWKWALGCSLAALPLIGCGQRSTSSAPTVDMEPELIAIQSATNVPPPAEVDQDLENAPGQIVSRPKAPANTLSTPAAEVVKLAQAGVEESVMMAYVTNSTYVFKLNSDDIIYLNDVGVPGTVVTAMLQRDQSVGTSTATVSAPPVYTNQLSPAPGAPTPYAAPETVQAESQPADVAVEPPQYPEQVNVASTYFYDSLSPYGAWIDVAGYGRCWQPTVVVVNRAWQPYCDNGRWEYSDCGWYWASDYSWGWAPFHYGRWFRHNRWGWCWAPDTVWGPSWVSWRYTQDYCGWAPLPPAACYRSGIGFTYYGRSVGVDFSFGLSTRHFAFVPVGNFFDRHPSRFRLPEHNVTRVFHNTTIVNQFDRGDHNRVINRGIPVEHFRSATRADIKPIQIRETDRPANARIERVDGVRTISAFHPNLPQPEGRTRLVGEGVRPATRADFNSRGSVTTRSVPVINNDSAAPALQTPAGSTRSVPQRDTTNRRDRQGVPTAPVVRSGPGVSTDSSVVPAKNEQIVPVRDSRTPSPRKNDAVIQPAPDHSASSDKEANPNSQRGRTMPSRQNFVPPRDVSQPTAPVVQPSTSIQSTPSPTTPAPSRTFPTRHLTDSASQAQPSAPITTATPAPVQSQPAPQRVFRQDARPSYTQPTTPAPVQQPQSAPVFQQPQRSEPRIQQPRSNPSFERATPSVRVEMPAAPRIESRQAAPVQIPRTESPRIQTPREQAPAPAARSSEPASRSSRSDRDRDPGNDGRRNR